MSAMKRGPAGHITHLLVTHHTPEETPQTFNAAYLDLLVAYQSVNNCSSSYIKLPLQLYKVYLQLYKVYLQLHKLRLQLYKVYLQLYKMFISSYIKGVSPDIQSVSLAI